MPGRCGSDGRSVSGTEQQDIPSVRRGHGHAAGKPGGKTSNYQKHLSLSFGSKTGLGSRKIGNT